MVWLTPQLYQIDPGCPCPLLTICHPLDFIFMRHHRRLSNGPTQASPSTSLQQSFSESFSQSVKCHFPCRQVNILYCQPGSRLYKVTREECVHVCINHWLYVYWEKSQLKHCQSTLFSRQHASLLGAGQLHNMLWYACAVDPKSRAISSTLPYITNMTLSTTAVQSVYCSL